MDRVTTCLENLEMSENLTAVRDMSVNRGKSCQEKKLFIVIVIHLGAPPMFSSIVVA